MARADGSAALIVYVALTVVLPGGENLTTVLEKSLPTFAAGVNRQGHWPVLSQPYT